MTPTLTPPSASVTPSPSITPTLAPPSPTVAGAGSPRLIGYYDGVDSSHHITDIPADRLTHLIYAFVKVSDNGECISIDPAADQANFPALKVLKQQHPTLETMVSIGGYNHSAKFSDAARSPDARRRFAQSCVQFMKQNGFDGIDVDWEFPVSGGLAGNGHRPEDKQNFTALLVEFRRQLDALGKADGRTYRLSIAASAGPTEIANIEPGQVAQVVDWIDVMAYAFYTGESKITNFNAPLYSTTTDPATDEKKRRLYNADATVQAYLKAGVPAGKISLGVPFYGRGWKGVPPANNGLYQRDGGVFVDSRAPKGTWSQDGEIDYRMLKQYYLGTWPRFWQAEAQVPWLYNAGAGVMVTYDDPQSLAAKADYARARHLGGIAIWQVSGDDGEHSLVNAIAAHLRGIVN
ncbi:MAG: glycoside hydrolase family 18 protein [Acidobacteriota bacterium]